MNFKQVLIILLVILYLIYTNMFYAKLLFPMKIEKSKDYSKDVVPTKSVSTSSPAKVSSMMEEESNTTESFTSDDNIDENYIADWVENAMKDKEQVKECLDLKKQDDNNSSIVNWIARQEYLAKGVCNDSKFCPCKRDEMII
jgi:hypothetical protein